MRRWTKAGVLDKMFEALEREQVTFASIFMQNHENHSEGRPPKSSVLVVDDHPINRLLMNSMLTKDGWLVVDAESADDAMLSLIRGLRPRVIFMDVRMPTVDGITAARRIRKWEERMNLPSVPIIALTADTLDETRARATEAGMNGYLTKPMSMDQLRSVLSTLPPP